MYISVFMFKKDKFSIFNVQVMHIGGMENGEMIIQEMTGRV